MKDLAEEQARWERECLGKKPVLPAYTDSGIEVKVAYTPVDLNGFDYMEKLGFPGEYPFTRGVYPSMYRGQLWSFRQYAGFATPEESNERYKYLLECGQTGLSVAFDLPTQLGYDSDNPAVQEEVGRVGVAIDTLKDMEILFEGIPLDKVSTSFTINAPAAIILAMYVAVGEKEGVPATQITGTLQNDILKEYLARGTYIYPPKPSMRLIADIMEYCAKYVPKMNTISISGYHVREAGANAIQEVAFCLAEAIAYVKEALARGMDVDFFAPRLSFIFASNIELFEEVAKYRACRRIWARIMKEKFGAKDPRSCMMRFFSGCAGSTYTKQEPLNNVIRGTLECLATVLGGGQSCHVMGYDEAYTIPSEQAARLGLRTQQVIAYESGVTKTADPMAGSYYVEALTDELDKRITALIEEIEAKGGIVELIEKGEIQRQVIEQAYAEDRKLQTGEKIKVGVNKFVSEEPEEEEEIIEFHEPDPEKVAQQIKRLNEVKAQRNNARVQECLAKIKQVAATNENLVPYILEAVKEYATVGEISGALREVFGEFQAPGGI